MRFRKWLAESDKVVILAWGIAAAILTVGLLVVICRLGFVHVVTGEWVTSAGALRDVALTLAAVIGFPIVIQRARSHDKQATAAREQAEANRKQAETDSRRRLAEAYSQAAALFAKTELPLRLAGLYALWKIAEEDPENHHVQIMRILCAFVRNPTPLDGWKQPKEPEKEDRIRIFSQTSKPPPSRPDINEVLMLILRRGEVQRQAEENANYSLDLRGANLQEVVFNNAFLIGADFEEADLADAIFRGVNVTGANFEWANLTAVIFDENVIFGDSVPHSRFRVAVLNGTDFSQVKGEVFQKIKNEISAGVLLGDNAGNPLTLSTFLLCEECFPDGNESLADKLIVLTPSERDNIKKEEKGWKFT